jgi:DNA polymerase-3 subunit alpha
MLDSKHFTHLHLHTDYSLLDGAISIDKLIENGKKNNRKALAISDHGNIFGAVKFFEKCKKAGIKPILGLEAYLTEDIKIKNNANRYYHLLLIVENEIGYKNICKLMANAYTKGFYFKPRIDYEILKNHCEGLFATSTCLGGHIPQLLLSEKYNEAKDIIFKMQDMFKDKYFLEVQPTYQSEQKIVNDQLFSLEKELGIPIIATGDCHYPSKEDRYAHEVMLAIQTRSLMTDKDRMTFGDCRAHIQSTEELMEMFPDRHDILWRTGEIADRCNFEFKTGKLFFPKFTIPNEHSDPESYFEYLSNLGFNNLINKNKIPQDKIDIYKARLNLEIQMINKMGFATYFLVVSDFIKWAKQNNIAVGPGRGSVVGSIVSWAIEITDIDPIKYNLLFERFLNPERISWPDIDIDFCINGREKVIQYVKDKYGHDKVGQIITFGSMMTKGVLKDVARALGFSFEDANSITNLVPDELKITIKEALEQEPKLKALKDQNSKIAELFDISERLEGLTRHASKHAAGIVISPEPIADVLPIYIPPKTNDIVTQYSMNELELLGFLKMDFLGLKNLTLITNITLLIKKNHNVDIDITELPLDDKITFDLLSKGDTSGVFQFESSGIKDVLKRLGPTCFEDLIAVNALYRPGPLGSGMVDDFIERKNGRQNITYLFPELENVLNETYGVIVYQEQVMKIASTIAGYSLAEADLLRRAMGKKKPEEMAKQKNIFIDRAIKNNFNEKKSDELFELMAYFAGYGFNKSHSTAYAMIAYQTAYLKAHFKVEFMSCLISLELSNPETSALYLSEIKASGISILKPDINISEQLFVPENNAIRFGFLGIKNVGETACQSIIKEREKNGKYKDLFDLCSKIDLRVCNKRVLENLIASGACDDFNKSRAEMVANVDSIIYAAQMFKEQKSSGQLGLFDNFKESNDKQEKPNIPWQTVQSWSLLQTLESEKEVLGVYISKHPLDEHDEIFLSIGIIDINNVIKEHPKTCITRGNLISMKEITTKKGDRMCFGVLEDQYSKLEVIFFPKIYQKYESIIKQNALLIIKGDASESFNNQAKIKAEQIILISEFNLNKNINSIEIHTNKINSFVLKEISTNLMKNGLINASLYFNENSKLFEHKLNNKIEINKIIIDNLKNLECKIIAEIR